MLRLKILPLITLLNLLLAINVSKAQDVPDVPTQQDSVKNSVRLLNRLMYSPDEWKIMDQEFRKSISGLIHHATDNPIDTTIVNMEYYLNSPGYDNIFQRDVEDIKDKDIVSGYVNDSTMNAVLDTLRSQTIDSLYLTGIEVPDSLLLQVADSASTIPMLPASELFNNTSKVVPKAFADTLNEKFIALELSPDLSLDIYDSIRLNFSDSLRMAYNEQQRELYKDSLFKAYRKDYAETIAGAVVSDRRFEIEQRNEDLLYFYNDSVVSATNRDAFAAINNLQRFAKRDSIKVTFTNLDGNEVSIWTSNEEGKNNFIRFYLKNMQNDSLGILVFNQGKGNANIFIDDPSVELTRIEQTEHKQATKLKEKKYSITDEFIVPVAMKAPVQPWDLGGQVSLGFTQTSLSNWSAGGESSLSGLFMGNYHFNYKMPTQTWENKIDIKYGINKNKDSGMRKNTDNLEMNSKYGFSAFKKWYYSGELNFQTQMAPGYNYDQSETDPTSKFMAPGRLRFSVGMDYKPTSNLSVMLSPLAVQATFVLDTDEIDETAYGLEKGKSQQWDPGFSATANYKHIFSEDMSFETNGSIFSKYKGVFKSINFKWEGKLNIQLNQYIRATVLCDARYNSDTMFPIYETDSAGKEVKVGEENRFEFKEMITLGFSYRFY
ncbi:DUF3078 domain-containing protein [Halosquirtibacter xylanolyticus]|uniref:DUF3078 domain-containing protein n=1 Tax=Halosquirtibacter xylanolyticus TaxID=3374599 RepID=UPI0037498DC4|nr:DUF3078 domain-containing protein [Prolixibacteraceae bacterium]